MLYINVCVCSVRATHTKHAFEMYTTIHQHMEYKQQQNGLNCKLKVFLLSRFAVIFIYIFCCCCSVSLFVISKCTAHSPRERKSRRLNVYNVFCVRILIIRNL